jgi:hypothetical protein
MGTLKFYKSFKIRYFFESKTGFCENQIYNSIEEAVCVIEAEANWLLKLTMDIFCLKSLLHVSYIKLKSLLQREV